MKTSLFSTFKIGGDIYDVYRDDLVLVNDTQIANNGKLLMF